jgi:hypothetical protein
MHVGGLAGQVSWIVTYPLDAVKTKIQISDNPQRMRDVFRGVWREGGVRGFYRGLEAAVVRAFPANAALFLVYEWSKKLMS